MVVLFRSASALASAYRISAMGTMVFRGPAGLAYGHAALAGPAVHPAEPLHQ
jgi:K+ transporter